MGMDMYIDAIKRDPNDKMNVLERKEMCYWRKFWDLHYNLPFKYDNDDYAQDIKLTKGDVEEILHFVSHNRDYFYGFKTVESVCELLDNYDELKADGWDIVYNANW